jgi:hypothetical protein
MSAPSYRNPALVERIVAALARFSFRKADWPADEVWQRMQDRARVRLAEGVEISELLPKLSRHEARFILECTIILKEAINSGDFLTVPKIAGPVRTIKMRHDELTGEESLDLYTDSGIVPGNDHLLRLLPPSSDPESAGAPQHLDAAPAAKPSRKPAAKRSRKEEKEENEIAIEFAAQQLRENPKFKEDKLFTQNDLYERLFGPPDKRAPHLKDKIWVTAWNPSRFKEKVWKEARTRAGREPNSPAGRRPDPNE